MRMVKEIKNCIKISWRVGLCACVNTWPCDLSVSQMQNHLEIGWTIICDLTQFKDGILFLFLIDTLISDKIITIYMYIP
jgi:hypothetical protein